MYLGTGKDLTEWNIKEFVRGNVLSASEIL